MKINNSLRDKILDGYGRTVEQIKNDIAFFDTVEGGLVKEHFAHVIRSLENEALKLLKCADGRDIDSFSIRCEADDSLNGSNLADVVFSKTSPCVIYKISYASRICEDDAENRRCQRVVIAHELGHLFFDLKYIMAGKQKMPLEAVNVQKEEKERNAWIFAILLLVYKRDWYNDIAGCLDAFSYKTDDEIYEKCNYFRSRPNLFSYN